MATTMAMSSLLRGTGPPVTRRLSYIPSGPSFSVTLLTRTPFPRSFVPAFPSRQPESPHRSRELFGCGRQVAGRRGDLLGRCVELLSRGGDLLGRGSVVLGAGRHLAHASRNPLDQTPHVSRGVR